MSLGSLRSVCLHGAAVLAFASFASAQTWEVAPTFSFERMSRQGLGTLSVTNAKKDDIKFKDGYSVGGRITWNHWNYYGMEVGYALNKPQINGLITPDSGTAVRRDQRVTVHQGSFSMIGYMMPKLERWRPYLIGGGQLFVYKKPNWPEYQDAGTRNYGGHFGAGMKLKIVNHANMRLEVRDWIGGKPYKFDLKSDSGTRLHQLEASVGFGITF